MLIVVKGVATRPTGASDPRTLRWRERYLRYVKGHAVTCLSAGLPPTQPAALLLRITMAVLFVSRMLKVKD